MKKMTKYPGFNEIFQDGRSDVSFNANILYSYHFVITIYMTNILFNFIFYIKFYITIYL